MKLIKKSDLNWQEFEDFSKGIFFNETEVSPPRVLAQAVKMKPHHQAKVHYHNKVVELFYGLKGKGYFLVNNAKRYIEPGDMLVIEPGEKHTVGNGTDGEFEFLAIKLNNDPKDTNSE